MFAVCSSVSSVTACCCRGGSNSGAMSVCWDDGASATSIVNASGSSLSGSLVWMLAVAVKCALDRHRDSGGLYSLNVSKLLSNVQ